MICTSSPRTTPTTNPDIDAFNDDVARHGGYQYTTNGRLSSRLANARLTDATLALADVSNKTVLDIGCGDGTYSLALCDAAFPASLAGVDPADAAIDAARRRAAGRRVTFSVGSAYQLPYDDGTFDWAYLRGVLHHLDRPQDALREALRVARRILVIEPNGYNPVVKLLEGFSRYHLAHDEKSYAPAALDRWVRCSGGEVLARQWAGLVPFFCPDWFARAAKFCEPLVERTPLVRAVACGVYVFVAQRQPPACRERGV